MRVLSLARYDGPRSLAARVVGATYEVEVRLPPPGTGATALLGASAPLAEAAARFTAASTLKVEEAREGRVREVDVKAYVDRLRVESGKEGVHTLIFRGALTPSGTARPERVVQAMSVLTGLELGIVRITRTEIEVA
jgi:hypothetical protein